MILIQNFFGFFQVEIFFGMFRPGQRHHDVEPVAQCRRFRRVRVHAFEFFQLAFDFFFDRLGNFCLAHFFTVLRDVFG